VRPTKPSPTDLSWPKQVVRRTWHNKCSYLFRNMYCMRGRWEEKVVNWWVAVCVCVCKRMAPKGGNATRTQWLPSKRRHLSLALTHSSFETSSPWSNTSHSSNQTKVDYLLFFRTTSMKLTEIARSSTVAWSPIQKNPGDYFLETNYSFVKNTQIHNKLNGPALGPESKKNEELFYYKSKIIQIDYKYLVFSNCSFF
jgi:hypothetical protein